MNASTNYQTQLSFTFNRLVRGYLRWEWLLFPLLVFMLLRAFTAFAAVEHLRAMPTGVPGWVRSEPPSVSFDAALPLPPERQLYQLLWPWQRFDTLWYTHIAQHGYQAGDPSVVFPPLYPTLTRLVAGFTGNNPMLAAILVSNGAALVAFMLLFRLVCDLEPYYHLTPLPPLHRTTDLTPPPPLQIERGRRTMLESASSGRGWARAAVVLLAAFPSAFFLMAGYSESLFLSLALGAFVLAFRGRWVLAGVLAGLATLTRVQGVVLALPLAYLALVQMRPADRGDWSAWAERVAAALGAPLALGLWFGYLRLSGLETPDRYWADFWHILTRPPWESVLAYIGRAAEGAAQFQEHDSAAAAVFVLATGILGVFAWPRRARVPFALFTFVTLALLLMRFREPGYTQLDSISRYAVTVFPCFIAAGWVFRHWWLAVVLLALALGGLYWMNLLLYQFTHWGFVG